MTNQEIRDSLSEKGLTSRGLISDLRSRLKNANNDGVDPDLNKKEAQLKDFRLEFDTLDSTHTQTFSNIKNPRKEQEWVSDNANLFTEEEAHYINLLIHSMFENIGVEVAIVTQTAVPETLTREEAANALFTHWRVGNFCAQKGLLIYIIKSEKAISLVVGNSLKSIINEERMQKFIEHQQKCLADGSKNFGEAVNNVLLECEALLEETVESPSKKLEEQERMNQSFLVRYRLLIFLILLFLSVLYMGSRNYFKMRCSKCYGNVNFTNIDLKLNKGEAIEKRLGSTAHVDKVCKECGHADRIRIDNPDFTLCPRCYFATIDLAKVPIPQNCEFCGMEVTDVSHIKNNRVPKPSFESTLSK